MARRALGLCLFLLLASPVVATEDRLALWGVVQICALNDRVSGAAFPCLAVKTESDNAGYVLIRPPLGEEDFILSPTRRLVGIEDPALQDEKAPNYFEDAWKSWAVVATGGRALPPRRDVAFAVNARFARTQDQLHIHIGCLADEAKTMLALSEPGLSSVQWRRLRRSIQGIAFWGLAIPQQDLAGVNPFRLAATGLHDEVANLDAVSLVLAPNQSRAQGDGFDLLAIINDPSRPKSARAGSEILKSSCQ